MVDSCDRVSRGIERRNKWLGYTCPVHDQTFSNGEKRMDKFEEKIDKLLEGQSKQAVSIQALQDAIGNGIRADIKRFRNAEQS